MTEYSYQVIYKPEGVATDITNWVDRIDAWEVGSGEIRHAKIRFNAMNGRFITNTDSGATPLIDEFDKIRLTITDRNGDPYDVIYEVDNVKPIQNSQVGALIEVELLGMEWHLQKTPFSKPFFEESGFQVTGGIIDIFNDGDVTGSLTPTVEGHDAVFGAGTFGNNFPKYTANVYPFDLREQSIYQGLMVTLDKMGSSVPTGGAGDFFEIGFQDNMTDPNFNTLQFRGFISGSPPDQSSVPTIDDTLALNPGEEEGGLEATMGFVQGTWGPDGIGTVPFENGLFAGALEIWNQYPEHIPGETYPAGAIIEDRSSPLRDQDDFYHYKANKDTTLAPPTPPTVSNADWGLHTFVDFLSTEVGIAGEYSKWTNGNANEWKSCGAKTDGTSQADPSSFNSLSLWDQNLVVVDGTYGRTWVHCKATSPANVPTQLLFPGNVFYRGFRVLVVGGTGDYASYDNQIIQYTGPTTFRTFKNPGDNFMCAVDNEGKVYQKQSGVWTDFSSDREGNDCYHTYWDIGVDQGFNDKDNGAGGNYGSASAITYEFRWKRGDQLSPTVSNYYRMGAWINLQFPFPPNSHNSNTLGEFYGNASASDKEPATFDAGNMHFATNGKKGFNNTKSMDLGPISSIRFKTKFLWKGYFDGTGSAVADGNFKCKIFCYDSSDNVVSADFVIPFNGEYTQTIDIPLPEFTIYRGRKPISVKNLASNIFLQQLEILNRFEWKNIQKVCLVWLGPYDDVGRFWPWGNAGLMLPWVKDPIENLFTDGFNVKWSIDGFEFVKAGLALTDPVSTRPTMLPFDDQPQILNSFQLKQHNDALLEIAQFRRVRYEIVTEGTCKEKFGDSIFLENSDLVREANRNESSPGANDGDPNTIKLVVKNIKYEITKPSNGPGGFLRYIQGVKRFV